MKTRYRIENRLFKNPLVVLQVGVERKQGVYISSDGDTLPPPWWDENEVIIDWRDATVEDLTALKEYHTGL